MAIPKNVFLGLIYKFPFTVIKALRLYVLPLKSVRLCALSQQKNVFYLPTKGVFLNDVCPVGQMMSPSALVASLMMRAFGTGEQTLPLFGTK